MTDVTQPAPADQPTAAAPDETTTAAPAPDQVDTPPASEPVAPDAQQDQTFPAGAWPQAPFQPVVPQFANQAGDRIRIWTNVAIFGLDARQEAEVIDRAEVHAAADAGLVEIRPVPAQSDVGA